MTTDSNRALVEGDLEWLRHQSIMCLGVKHSRIFHDAAGLSAHNARIDRILAALVPAQEPKGDDVEGRLWALGGIAQNSRDGFTYLNEAGGGSEPELQDFADAILVAFTPSKEPRE